MDKGTPHEHKKIGIKYCPLLEGFGITMTDNQRKGVVLCENCPLLDHCIFDKTGPARKEDVDKLIAKMDELLGVLERR